MVVPPKHPKMIIFSRKTMVVGYHHFRKSPFGMAYFFEGQTVSFREVNAGSWPFGKGVSHNPDP